MILYKDKNFITCSSSPDTDFRGDADYVIPDDSQIAQDIQRLWPNFKIITELDEDGKEIVTGVEEFWDTSLLITEKCEEINKDCENAIHLGVDLTYNGVTSHYALTEVDQINITNRAQKAFLGESTKYHADGEVCRWYSAEEMLALSAAAETYIEQQTTMCNLLKKQVQSMTEATADEIKAVKFGTTELTGEFLETYNSLMTPATSETKASE